MITIDAVRARANTGLEFTVKVKGCVVSGTGIPSHSCVVLGISLQKGGARVKARIASVLKTFDTNVLRKTPCQKHLASYLSDEVRKMNSFILLVTHFKCDFMPLVPSSYL